MLIHTNPETEWYILDGCWPELDPYKFWGFSRNVVWARDALIGKKNREYGETECIAESINDTGSA